MDLIQNFIDKEGGRIISELTSRGFSAEQASGFLPEALATLMQGLRGADFADLLGSASTGGLAGLPQSVDIAALASRTGVESSNAEIGLNTLIPRLTAFIEDNQHLSGLFGERAGDPTRIFKSLHH